MEQDYSEIYKEHTREIRDLVDKSHNNKEVLIKLSADVEHVKGRIDNGISETITKIWDKVNEMNLVLVKTDKETTDNAESIISANKRIDYLMVGGIISVLGLILTLWFK